MKRAESHELCTPKEDGCTMFARDKDLILEGSGGCIGTIVVRMTLITMDVQAGGTIPTLVKGLAHATMVIVVD